MLTDRSRIARSLCSALAIATATLLSTEAHAQTAAPSGSFQGNGTFNSGSGSIVAGPNTTTINLTSPNAVIDWSTLDTATGGGAINFQPSSTTATFQSTVDFTVLNRILPTDPSRAVQFNGNVISQIQGTSPVPGGTVYFYSPGGIIVGSTAVFNVGNLGLTSAAPQVVSGVFEQKNPVTGLDFVKFTSANPGTGVDIQAGAQITGTGGVDGNYLAVVAPRVTNAGAISGKRVTALISADAVTMTLNVNGLFDIQVDSGTSATGTTLFNSGSITGPAGTAGFASRLYLVAVPKNTAITMAIAAGSTLGFNIAGAADVAGNAVILSAGSDVIGGQVQAARSTGGGTGTVAIDAYNAAFTSDVRGRATGRALFAAGVGATGGSGTTSFAAGVAIHSDTIVSLEARANGTISVAGNATLDADQSLTFLATATTGGQAYLDSRDGGSLNIGGNAVLSAGGLGGNATGGNTSATALNNGMITVAGVLRVRADGFGSNGGSGTGGTAVVNAQTGGDITSSQLNVAAIGVGGNDTDTGAGSGTGGSASVLATGTGSTISVANGNSIASSFRGGLDFLSASGFGGVTNGGGSGVGGAARGGTVSLSATAGAVISGPANTGTQSFVRIIARAFGGDANTGVAGGLATGGIINITIDNATFTSADLLPSSFALGGSALATTGTINGGNAVGGQRNIFIRNGATANTSFSGGGPGAQGGDAASSGRGGDGSGGNASLVVDNATLTLSGRSVVFSQNQSGSGATAGNVTAGTAYAQVSNGGVLNVPDDPNSVYDFSVLSNAFGPAAGSVAGNAQGNVTAGNATLLLQGGTINGPGSISVQAGAAATSDQYAQGGTYLGGQASLQLQGGTISSPTIYVSANADAGAVGAGLSGTGGSATGGSASVQASGTTTNLTGGQLLIESLGLGGNVFGSGTGGDGTGGMATLRAFSGGTLNLSGNAFLTADGTGGSATGTASAGTGGAGTGGTARLVGNAGTVVVTGSTNVTSSGSGGNGSSGGAGGIGAGGTSQIDALNNVAGSATINLGAVTIGTDGTGGFGGAGLSGAGFGGAGGAGTGGNTQALGAAGNGNLTTGNVVATALGIGGAGGAGGTGATGGAGGAGGQAVGGFIQIGSASFLDNSPTNTGSATFGSLAENASAFGGNGGAGGSGTTQGVGGNGGAAFDGRSIILVRGSPVTFNGAVSLIADAIGGGGGAGSIRGNGGNATVGIDPVLQNAGGIAVVVTNRFLHPEQPGRLTAGSIVGTANATGGAGATAGASFLGGQPLDLTMIGASATINSLDLSSRATTIIGTLPSLLALTGATADISNLSLVTTGLFSVALDTATLNTANLSLSAANFVLPATPPTAFGTFNVSNSLSVTTGLDFLAYANFNLAFNAALMVPGSIQVGDVIVNGTLQANAGTTLTAGNVQASDVTLQGNTGLTTGTITAAERIKLTAPQGPIATGALQAGDTVVVSAGGALSVASASAGIVNPSTNTLAEYNIGLRSLTSITTGALSARASIGLVSPGTITVGNLSAAGLGVLALAGTGLTTGSISAVNPVTGAPTGRIYLANFSMEALGGQIGQNFDPTPILAATPVAIAGPVTINGAVSGSVFQLAATDAITTGAITSRESIEIVGGAAITSGALVAGNTVEARAVGALNVASASAGIVNPSTSTAAEYTVALRSLASITAGALSARANVGLSSPGSITVGNISANQIVLALAGTGLTTGSITTLSGGRVYLANFSMEALGGQITQSFDPAPILAASPASIAGPIVVGVVSTGVFQAATTQAFSSGNITTASFTRVIADGSLSTGAVTAGQTVSLQSGAALSTGAVQAGDAVGIAATGGFSTGNVSAGIVNPSTNPAATYKIAIASQTGAISTGTLTARRDIGLQAAQSIATGDIAGRDVLLLAGTGVTTGAILAGSQTQPTGRVYIGNFSMARSGANVFSPFTTLTLFNIDPVRTGGAITIGGAVTAGSLYASTAQGISLQAVTAGTSTSLGFIDIDAGGLATINGRLAAARKIDIASRDIDITATGSLDGLIALSEIQLASNNPNGAFIGDGLTTTSGYMLSNAEYSRLRAGQIAVIGDNQSELVTDMTIGNLSIAGSQLYGTGGTALFATGNRDTQTPSGLLRINGAVSASGFTATNEIDLLSGTVELEAEKGSLKIDNGSGGLGGQIVVEADHFHVASDTILTKLRADPLYEGHIKELNAPALVQRTDGVLNALNVDFSSKSQTVYVQNTGSVAVPAGILTRLDTNTSTSNNNTSNEAVRPPGGSEFVINGQIQTNTGIVTGKAAFDLVIASLKAEAVADGKTFASDLTPTSTFNGCVIATGVCAFGNADPVAALSSEITVVTNATLDESPVAPAADDSDEGDDGSGDQDDEDSKSDDGSSPIAPPAPLISTRALDGNVNVVEPVSGAGNPALFGSAVDETTAQGEKP